VASVPSGRNLTPPPTLPIFNFFYQPPSNLDQATAQKKSPVLSTISPALQFWFPSYVDNGVQCLSNNDVMVCHSLMMTGHLQRRFRHSIVPLALFSQDTSMLVTWQSFGFSSDEEITLASIEQLH
jgi:hypothetical protein